MIGPMQSIVVLGGFPISAESYTAMLTSLEQLSGQPASLVAVGKPEWLLTVFPFAWARILDRVAAVVCEQASRSPTGRVTLIGHSSGGIMLRLFLDDRPFQGRCYRGRRWADTLVMLGSPHTALEATPLRAMVAERLPGGWFSDPSHISDLTGATLVQYISVAGDLALDDPDTTAMARRLAPTAYRKASGSAEGPGDGLVPLSSALLEGSQAVVLPGVAHGGAFGRRWYGSQEVVEQWWPQLKAPGVPPPR